MIIQSFFGLLLALFLQVLLFILFFLILIQPKLFIFFKLNLLGLETKIIKSFFLIFELKFFLSYLKNKSHDEIYIVELLVKNFFAL